MTTDKRIVEGYDLEYNTLARTLKMNLVLDEEAIRLVLQTSGTELTTPEELGFQVLELLERGICNNLPRGVQAGPNGKRWNNVK
jgi:hypothetical protein|tara:strand:+ start:159 stop:410 length:252 start_codon:yes stop_codon:yes gene_type:complete